MLFRSAKNIIKQSREDDLTDSIFAEDFPDTSLRDLPSSQLAFHQDVANPKRQGVGMESTSTPDMKLSKQAPFPALHDKKPAAKARRSMTDQLKKAMLENAVVGVVH